MPSLEGRHDDARILVPVVVALPSGAAGHGMEIGQGLIDTGATRLLITSDIARKLDLPVRGKHPLVSARSIEMVLRYSFSLGFMLSVGGRAAAPFMLEADFVGSEFRKNDNAFDVFVGMDVLGLGTLQMTPDRKYSFHF